MCVNKKENYIITEHDILDTKAKKLFWKLMRDIEIDFWADYGVEMCPKRYKFHCKLY